MIEKTVTINATPKEVANLLFELNDIQVAEVFKEWKLLFDKNYEERKENGETIWIFDLQHFLLHVAKHLDKDGVEAVRSFYSSVIYHNIKDIVEDNRI